MFVLRSINETSSSFNQEPKEVEPRVFALHSYHDHGARRLLITHTGRYPVCKSCSITTGNPSHSCQIPVPFLRLHYFKLLILRSIGGRVFRERTQRARVQLGAQASAIHTRPTPGPQCPTPGAIGMPLAILVAPPNQAWFHSRLPCTRTVAPNHGPWIPRTNSNTCTCTLRLALRAYISWDATRTALGSTPDHRPQTPDHRSSP